MIITLSSLQQVNSVPVIIIISFAVYKGESEKKFFAGIHLNSDSTQTQFRLNSDSNIFEFRNLFNL